MASLVVFCHLKSDQPQVKIDTLTQPGYGRKR
jgi:hypothetical protein